MQVTIFPNIKTPDKPYYVTIETIVNRIKTGKSKDIIDKLRDATEKDERQKIKGQLPSICFSGKFTKRANEKLIEHSGLVAIDFDHLGERLNEFKTNICNDKHTFIAFISPSGDGLKVVVKIPASIKTHALSCDALSDYYKEETLDNFKDVARVCYESFDTDIYYNPQSDVFTVLKETEVIKRTIETVDIITDFDMIFNNIVKWLDKSCIYYSDGNKHKFLVSLASACLRFGIPEYVAIQKAVFSFINKASSVDPKDYEEIFKRVYSNYSHSACTAHFDKKNEAIETITKTKLTDAIFDITLPLKDVIYLDAVRDSMLQTFHSGHSRGETTYFKNIDEHWRWKRKHIVLMHGIMNHGKSSLTLQLCLIKSLKNGYKWGVFSPEQDPPDDFYDELIHSFVGKSTQPYHSNQMSENEYLQAMDFIKEHFFYIYPSEATPTPEYINDRFEELIKKHKIDGCIIDPYNQLDNDIRKSAGREDLYLSSFLTTQKRFAQKHNIFMIIITHPKSGLTKNSNGDYSCPDVFDLAGGAMWGNKCDDILCTYRPYFSSNKEDTSVMFISQKIKKRKLCGTPGDVQLTFDILTNRFYELIENGRYKTSPFDQVYNSISKEAPRPFHEPQEKEFWNGIDSNTNFETESPF
jgi:twinkle protein